MVMSFRNCRESIVARLNDNTEKVRGRREEEGKRYLFSNSELELLVGVEV